MLLDQVPIEIFLRITDFLGAQDIITLSYIKEFRPNFKVLTDGDKAVVTFNNELDVGLLDSDAETDHAIDCSRIHFIEINGSLSALSVLEAYHNCRKVISFIDNRHDDVFLNSMVMQFIEKFDRNTKYNLVGFKTVSLDNAFVLPYCLSLQNVSSFSLSNCVSIDDNDDPFELGNIRYLQLQQCSSSIIKSFSEIAAIPLTECKISLKESSGDDFCADSLKIDSRKIKLYNVSKVESLEFNSCESLVLSFSSNSYVGSLRCPYLKTLSVELSSTLPTIPEIHMPFLQKLELVDNHDTVNDDFDMDEAGDVDRDVNDYIHKQEGLEIIVDLKLKVNNGRLLKNLDSFRSLKLLDIHITKDLEIDTINLDLQLDKLILRLDKESTKFPMVRGLNDTLIHLEIFNLTNREIIPFFKIDEYINLTTLAFSGINNYSNWFGNGLMRLEEMRLLNLQFINGQIEIDNLVVFSKLTHLEISNHVLDLSQNLEIEVNLNTPVLETLILNIMNSVDDDDENSDVFEPEVGLWDEYETNITLSLNHDHISSIETLILNNISELKLRNLLKLQNIYHGGSIQLMKLDADYLPNLKNLIYKNKNKTRPIQSVNFINPEVKKIVSKDSIHPKSNVFSPNPMIISTV